MVKVIYGTTDRWRERDVYGRIDRWRERDVYGRIVLIDSIIFAYSEKCSSNYKFIKYQKLV